MLSIFRTHNYFWSKKRTINLDQRHNLSPSLYYRYLLRQQQKMTMNLKRQKKNEIKKKMTVSQYKRHVVFVKGNN